ncbi:MAG TPA: acetylglutamate kinase [Deltaproteobacteria bacterium]|nr:acetylglutamate kinase [Deltaproteobacteria bacterium]
MTNMMEKIDILLEALPYIKRFSGSTFVIKYGGAAMEEEALKHEFAKDIVLLKYVGINPVVVHGGGPQIERLLTKLQIPTRFVDGLRVTDEATLEVVEMVLSGLINKRIVKDIQDNGGQAIGLSGKDGRLVMAKQVEGKDIGLVGQVVGVNALILKEISKTGYVPVIAPLGCGIDGNTYNINADTVAGAVAKALLAEKLILLTDVPGVLDEASKPISVLKTDEVRHLLNDQTIRGGMIPKVKCCMDALHGGVKKTHIIDGRVPHALLLEVFTRTGIGTQIAGEE